MASIPNDFAAAHKYPCLSRGNKQRILTAARIKQSSAPEIVFTSSLGRCIATGEAIAAACGVQSQILPGLFDIDYGAWQWKTHDEVRQSEPDAFGLWKKFPDQMQMPEGESLQQVLVRAARELSKILKDYKGKTIVMVSHDSVNRVLLLQMLGLPLGLSNKILAALTRLSFMKACSKLRALMKHGTSTSLIRSNSRSWFDSKIGPKHTKTTQTDGFSFG